jgi:hypothetical protein
LVDTSYHAVINHSNAVVAKMVAQAKNLRIAWLRYDNTDEDLMRSYCENSIFLSFKKFAFSKRLLFLSQAIYYYMTCVFFAYRIRSFKYKGIPYDDFIYDSYLAHFSMATLHRFDIRMIKAFYILILKDEQSRALLTNNNIKAVLVAHYIGTDSGPLSRVAMQKNIPLYWKGGGRGAVNLSVYTDLKDRYDYPRRPSLNEVNLLATQHKKRMEDDFQRLISQQFSSCYTVFSVGYNNKVSSDITRARFLKEMKLEDKPLIFIFLHAFNDYPMSHFNSMLFKDYYDWFIQTHRYALKDRTKNWIFKDHPSSKMYPTKDLNLSNVFKNSPAHIKFLPHDSPINASAVLNIADLIVTCVGTAGIEMPALAGIPTLVAGKTFYDRLGFTLDPCSKEEYFQILKDFSPARISGEKQMLAKCCFLYLAEYVSIPFAAGPMISYEEYFGNQDKLLRAYLEKIIDGYKEKSTLIYEQFNWCTEEIKRDGFRRLVRFPG